MSPVLIKGLMGAGFLSMGGVGVWQLTEYMAPKTLQQKLEREGYTFHPFDDDNNLGGWKGLAKAYKTSTNDNSGNKFTSLTINSENPTDDEAKSLRGECKKLAVKEITTENQDQDLTKLKTWCAASPATASSGTGLTQ